MLDSRGKIMAIQIPQQRVSANVGNVQLEGVQRTGQEGQAFSQALSQVGQAGMEMAQRSKAKADVANVQEQVNGLSTFTNDSLYGKDGLYTKKGKNALNASDELLTAFDKQVSDQSATLTDDTQKELYLQQSSKMRGRLEADSMRYQSQEIQTFEQQQQASYVTNLQVDAANNYQNEVRINDVIGDQLSSIRANGELNGLPEDTIKLNQLTAMSQTHVGVANRMLADQDYNGVKEYVDSYEDQIFPEKRDQLLKVANDARNAAMAKETKKLSSEINDYVLYKNSGGEEVKEYSESSLKAIYGDEQGAAVHEEILDANEFATTYNQVKFATSDEIKEIISTSEPTTADRFQRESRQYGNLVKAVQARSTQLAKDPSKYVLENDDVRNEFDTYSQTGVGTSYAAATVAEQGRIGVPSQMVTILPKETASSLVAEYQKGGQNAAEFMQSLRNSWGEYFPQVMRDLNQAGLSPTAQVVSILPQGNTANLLAEADQQGMKELKTFIGDDDSKTITTDVSDELSDLRETLALTPNGPASYKKLLDATNLLAHKYSSMGVGLGDAISRAADEVVNSRYEFVDGYRVPVSFNDNQIDASTVRNGIDFVIRDFGKLDLYLPDHQGMPDDVAEKIYKQNLQATATTMNDDSGIVFVDQNGNSILDQDTNPITMTWDELLKAGEGKDYVRVPKTGTRGLFY